MIVNQLIALDVQLNKQDSYKYFSMENNMFTWMDHIISTEYDADSVKCCDIVELQAGNLSDNLPIHIKLCLSLPCTSSPSASDKGGGSAYS